MLVLSRRAGEQIVFPNLGITVNVVRVQGNAVRVGVDAPPEVKVYRGELVPTIEATTAKSASHELNNRLNQVTLGLHLYQRQRDAGQLTAADKTLNDVLAKLAAIDRNWIKSRFDGPNTAAQPGCRTLLVEDDANERELLAGILRHEGYAVDTASDGDDALNYLADHERPDVVLLDMVMPRRDGPQTLKAIRDDGRYAGMRIFAVSGSSPADLGIVTGPGGIDAWFPKPLNPKKLLETLKSASAVN